MLMYGILSFVWQKKHESRNSTVKMRPLRSMCEERLIDRNLNAVKRESCGLKQKIVTMIEKGMLKWFKHVKRMMNQIYKANTNMV